MIGLCLGESVLGAGMATSSRRILAPNAYDRRTQTLEAIAAVLRAADRPLHTREIAIAIQEQTLARLTGRTPWKTVNARLSEDIRSFGAWSRFMRTALGLFALREWDFATEFEVARRRINPINEVIRVVPSAHFQALKANYGGVWLNLLPFETAIEASIEMPRREAEESDSFVQLIPTFIVRRGRRVWTFTRTRRLPEARLHNAKCLGFGGHMQAGDEMPLFKGQAEYRDSVLRELFEELSFSNSPKIEYLGVLHLTGSLFERQHAGLIFDVQVGVRTHVASLEPGMHTNVRTSSLEELLATADELDSSSQQLVRVLHERC